VSRGLIALALATWSLALGGCVFLRLLQVKNQLAEFDRYIETDLRDGLKITFKKPVLLDEDFEGFFKWIPEKRERLNSAEKWHFRWLKDHVAADGERPPYALEFDVLFADHKLTKIMVTESFFAAVLPKHLAVGFMRSMGRAKVDQKNRSATTTLEDRDVDPKAEEPPLTREGVTALLGTPVSVIGDDASPQWYYKFSPATNQRMGRNGEIEATFSFDAATGRVRQLQGKTPWGAMTVTFENPEPAAEAANPTEPKT
jgi:hypothetical protein